MLQKVADDLRVAVETRVHDWGPARFILGVEVHTVPDEPLHMGEVAAPGKRAESLLFESTLEVPACSEEKEDEKKRPEGDRKARDLIRTHFFIPLQYRLGTGTCQLKS